MFTDFIASLNEIFQVRSISWNDESDQSTVQMMINDLWPDNDTKTAWNKTQLLI